MNTKRRLVKVALSKDWLLDFIIQDNEIVGIVKTIKGIPKDAKFIGSTFDDTNLQACIICEHPDFRELQEGEQIPYFDVVMQKYTPANDAVVAMKIMQELG